MASRDRCDEEIKQHESVNDEGRGESEHRDGGEGLRRHTGSGAKAIQ
jgi:hypothetical protein